jgi:SAM-dependent methyltransferase
MIAKHIFREKLKRDVQISDIGCGYGGFSEFLNKTYPNLRYNYIGYDIADKLVEYCKTNITDENLEFRLGSNLHAPCDFCVISGTFNYAPGVSVDTWRDFMRNELLTSFKYVREKLIFNLMISDSPKISKSNIFYENLEDFLSFCNNYLGRTSVYEHKLLKHEKTFCVEK